MLIAILFWSLCLTACAYAVLLGGWEGRWTTLTIILASVATLLVNRWSAAHQHDVFWANTNELVLIIDVVTFAVMYVTAAKSERWWPLWVAAFQLNSVVAHIATAISPQFSASVYQGYEGLWAIPGQLVMIFGIYRDRRWKNSYDLA